MRRETRSSASQKEESRVTAHLATTEETLQSLVPLNYSVDSLSSLPYKTDQLLELKLTSELLKATFAEVQKSIILSEKCDQILISVTTNDEIIMELQMETTTLRAAVSQQFTEIKIL